MLRWLAACVALCAVAFVVVALASQRRPDRALLEIVGVHSAEAGPTSARPGGDTDRTAPDGVGEIIDPKGNKTEAKVNKSEPVKIDGAGIRVRDFQEVPSERDGQLLFVARELGAGDGKLREAIDKILADPLVSIDPEKRRLALSDIGVVEEKITYLASLLVGDYEVKAYNDLNDHLNFPIPDDKLKRTFRRYLEDQPQPPLRADRIMVYQVVEQMKKIQVGDWVEKGQRLALIKPDLAVADLDIKVSKLKAAEADRLASAATRDEFEVRTKNYKDHPNSGSKEDIRSAELQYERYKQEEIQKRSVIESSKSELKAALTTLRLHDVRAGISGVVRAVYKNPGDAVFQLEAVLRIENPDRVRVEGQVDVQEARKLRLDMPVVVEATRPDSPMLVLRGHMQEVHGVAVCAGRSTLGDAASRPVIISGSEDKKVCGWSINGAKQWEIKYSAGVRAVACTPPGVEDRFVAAGTADGAVRLLDLNHIEDKAALGRFCKGVLGFSATDFSHMIPDKQVILNDPAVNPDTKRAHGGAVTCIAFSPDGKLVVTGGEDYSIALWEVPSGNFVGRVTKAHKQSVTSLQIVKSVNEKGQPVLNEQGQPVVRMLSAGRDNVLTLWTLNEGKVPTRDRDFDRRSGDVAQLSSDGRRFLFDQGKELRLLSLTTGQLVGRLQNPPAAGSFTTLAMFAPNGQTILTNGTGETGLQLWRASEAGGRGSEVRQFMWTQGRATCAAFSPVYLDSDGKPISVVVTGTNEDHQVLVWKMPSKEEVQTPLYAKVSLVEETLEPGSNQLRVWADLQTKPDWLLPGTKARMVIDPSAR